MLGDTDLIPVICKNCGFQSEKEIGWLRAKALARKFACVRCRTPFGNYSAQLEFIVRDDASKSIRKLWLSAE